MKDQVTLKVDRNVPQLRVRSGLSVGESVDACLNNLNYWRNEAYKKCNQKKPTQIGYY